MTVKENSTGYETATGKAYGSSFPSNEPDIPVAFASVLDEQQPPATAQGYAASSTTAYGVTTATPTPQPTVVQASNIHQTNPVIHPTTIHTNTVTPSVVVQGQPIGTSTTKPPPSKPSPPNFGSRPIPPNAPPGGQWVVMKYSGNKTLGIIGGTACCLFWCCFMFAAPLALLGLACPCDERTVYLSPNGVMYDETGHAVGDRRRNKYKIIGNA